MAVTVASAESPRGGVVLLRRDDGALELRVNGMFVMDTLQTSTERYLATLALDALSTPDGQLARPPDAGGWRVLVGGLGLGFTVSALVASPVVGEIVVAEIEPALVDWHRWGLVAHTRSACRDPRVRVEVGDVRDALAARTSPLDAILLDVDNGPAALVHADNRDLYEAESLTAFRGALAPGGVLLVWSAARAPLLVDALRTVFGNVRHRRRPVRLGGRDESYHLYLSRRVAAADRPSRGGRR